MVVFGVELLKMPCDRAANYKEHFHFLFAGFQLKNQDGAFQNYNPRTTRKIEILKTLRQSVLSKSLSSCFVSVVFCYRAVSGRHAAKNLMKLFV